MHLVERDARMILKHKDDFTRGIFGVILPANLWANLQLIYRQLYRELHRKLCVSLDENMIF